MTPKDINQKVLWFWMSFNLWQQFEWKVPHMLFHENDHRSTGFMKFQKSKFQFDLRLDICGQWGGKRLGKTWWNASVFCVPDLPDSCPSVSVSRLTGSAEAAGLGAAQEFSSACMLKWCLAATKPHVSMELCKGNTFTWKMHLFQKCMMEKCQIM